LKAPTLTYFKWIRSHIMPLYRGDKQQRVSVRSASLVKQGVPDT